ncbi:MAG: RNA-binding S4 domain-containing protein [Halocynthiibacter sp.]
MRVDKWLWHTRFFKTRARATTMVTGGHLRINQTKTAKPAAKVRVGDTLTFLQEKHIRVIEVTALSIRRGPAPEAQTHFLDHSPEANFVTKSPRFEGKGRPSAKDRRNARLSKFSPLE